MTVNLIDELDDRAVVLVVQYLEEDLRDKLAPIQTEAEARLVISELLTQAHVADITPSQLLGAEPAALAAARRALAAATADPDTWETTAKLLADPPRDEQMSVEAALASTAVLAFLISWLQTKVTLRIHRRNGKTEVEFTITKQAADTQVIRAIATTFRSILGIPAASTSPHDDSD